MKKQINSDTTRLDHILQAIQNIEDFIAGATRESFLEDHRLQSAVLYQFLIIGEAVNSLSMDLINKSDYPWYKPRAFRNFIAHEYFGIKMWMVWNTMVDELPKLKSTVVVCRENQA